MLRLLLICLPLVLAACASTPAPPQQHPRPAELKLVAMDGAPLRLDMAMADGKGVVLVFWQTWCESCLEEAPALAQAAREHTSDYVFVGVVPGPDDTVDDGEVHRLAAELELPYPQVRDRDLSLTRAFGVEGTPTIVIMDSNGDIRFSGHRVPDWTQLR